MKSLGREGELTAGDKIRATSIGAVKGFANMLGLGKKKPEAQ